jgi:hypothetical protein
MGWISYQQIMIFVHQFVGPRFGTTLHRPGEMLLCHESSPTPAVLRILLGKSEELVKGLVQDQDAFKGGSPWILNL